MQQSLDIMCCCMNKKIGKRRVIAKEKERFIKSKNQAILGRGKELAEAI
jgi:hypothetical protein